MLWHAHDLLICWHQCLPVYNGSLWTEWKEFSWMECPDFRLSGDLQLNPLFSKRPPSWSSCDEDCTPLHGAADTYVWCSIKYINIQQCLNLTFELPFLMSRLYVHKPNSDAHMIFYRPGKMLTELFNDPEYNKTLRKLIVCLLDSSDTVTGESMCQRNKLCSKAISLVPLHG